MKKIYVNERFIGVSDLVENSLSSNFEQIEVTDHKDIPNLLKYFDESPNMQALILKSGDAASLYDAISSHFKLIDAAGGLVFNTLGEVLLINRWGKWDLPKGKVEKGEPIDQAALREVEEECGISNLALHNLITKTYHTYPHKGKVVLKTTYWYLMRYSGSEVPTPQTSEDITQAIWVSPFDLDDYLINTYETIREVFRRIQRKE